MGLNLLVTTISRTFIDYWRLTGDDTYELGDRENAKLVRGRVMTLHWLIRPYLSELSSAYGLSE